MAYTLIKGWADKMDKLIIIREKRGKTITKIIRSNKGNFYLYNRYLTKVLGLGIVLDENMVLK